MALHSGFRNALAAAIYGAASATSVGGCATGSAWLAHERSIPQPPPLPPIASPLDIPLLDGATYVALVEWRLYDGQVVRHIASQRGQRVCRPGAAFQGLTVTETCQLRFRKTINALDRPALIAFDGERHVVLDAAGLRARGVRTPNEAVLAAWFWHLEEDRQVRVIGLDCLCPEQVTARAVDGGFEVVVYNMGANPCPNPQDYEDRWLARVILHVTERGEVTRGRTIEIPSGADQADCDSVGRRPEAFVDVPVGETLVSYARRAMHHEAESVRAFSRLARELGAHGAPSALIAAAHEAEADERRHALLWAELLGGWGEDAAPSFAPDLGPVRPLEQVALENATAGCVHETYAAARACHQARSAPTEAMRACFASLVEDELDHATLAWQCHAWSLARLGRAERGAVRGAMRAERAVLEAFLRVPPSAVRWQAGEPTPEDAARLLAACPVG